MKTANPSDISTLHIDIETRSGADLSKSGVYRYAEDPDFDILLFGVSLNGGPVTVYDLASGEALPEEILKALADPAVQKWAYNASFERICLSRWLKRHAPEYAGPGPYLDPAGWRCTMILAAYGGLPFGLEKTGQLLGLEEQKLKEGKELIRFFSVPLRPAAPEERAAFRSPGDDPMKWEWFRRYNARDVEVEMRIHDRLRAYPMPAFLWEEYALDQRINDLGIRVDRQLVDQAIRLDARSKRELTAELKAKTGLENPGSVVQMKSWLARYGLVTDSLGRKEVKALLDRVPPDIAEVLSLRLRLAKSSVRKYQAMENCVCADGRCRGMFQFLGAGRTGRWAGRLIQLQNLPQNHLSDLDEARSLVKSGLYEYLRFRYDNVPETLSQLIRTAFIPREGYRFIVADYSAIEARVLAYLAGETWRTDVFRAGGDIYCASASAMFHVPVEKNGPNAHLRRKGKIAELALGYGGAVGALKAMGAAELGLGETELRELVDRWREANPHIVRYWWRVDEAIKETLLRHIQARVGEIRFRYDTDRLRILLPSGRNLVYLHPRIELNDFGGESVTYAGQDSTKKWGRLESYGPKFTENIVQAVSRDILAAAMERLRHLRIVGHVHDELIIEAPEEVTPEEICEEMSRAPSWLPGICLHAEGYACATYRKL